MEEIIEQEQVIYSTKYAKLPTLEVYQALNEAIGVVKNYPDDKSDTYYYSTPEPTVNVDGNYYMEITPQVQRDYSVLEGVVLVDKLPDNVNLNIE